MSKDFRGPGEFRRRLVGLYALSLMEREGPLYGYRLSEAIAERTHGTWRPGPGSVYPSLQKLVEAKFATTKVTGRRKTYSITAEGRRFLKSFRFRGQGLPQARLDAAALWAEIHGERDAGELLLHRLNHNLESVEEFLGSTTTEPEERQRLRARVVQELELALDRYRKPARAHGTSRRAHG